MDCCLERRGRAGQAGAEHDETRALERAYGGVTLEQEEAVPAPAEPPVVGEEVA